MKIDKFYFFILIFACLFSRQNLVSAQEQKLDEPVSTDKFQTEEELIHAGDLVDVDVVGSTEYDWRGTLTPEGFLNGVGYLESPIYAVCRNEREVAADVSRAVGKFLREPKVEVKILDRSNRPLSMLYGAVKMPQRFQIKRPVFLNELLIVSGGLTDKASGEIQILRPPNLNCSADIIEKPKSENDGGLPKETFIKTSRNNSAQYIIIKVSDLLTGKKDANPRIFGGDIVTVGEAGLVYIIGGVTNPKQIYIRSQMTVSRAIASAGGFSKDALPQKITISRREGSERKIVEIDYEKIKINPAEDLILQPSDIVEVGQKGNKKSKPQVGLKTVESAIKNISVLPLRVID